ncbi:hypothetical protein ACCD06_27880 [Azospirillum sp. CT11-132]|uniref:hypothetical protein n=1 Tax=Azospirillum sp. CT11-132 TaxID=3396317 RepID=UPI0039A408CD
MLTSISNLFSRFASGRHDPTERKSDRPRKDVPVSAYVLSGPKAQAVTPVGGRLSSLPDGLIIEPGSYQVGNQGFLLDRVGVYCFYQPGGFSTQRLVCPGTPDALLQHAGWLWGYGTAHEGENEERDYDSLRFGPRILGCSRLAFLSVRLFREMGLQARPAALATTEAWNSHDNGHSLVEVFNPDTGWFLYDPSFRCCLTVDGRYCSVLDWIREIRSGGSPVVVPLPGYPPSPFFHVSGSNFGNWITERTYSSDALLQWYRRMAGVPLLWDNGCFHFPEDGVDTEIRKRLKTMLYHPMSKATFSAYFYDIHD